MFGLHNHCVTKLDTNSLPSNKSAESDVLCKLMNHSLAHSVTDSVTETKQYDSYVSLSTNTAVFNSVTESVSKDD